MEISRLMGQEVEIDDDAGPHPSGSSRSGLVVLGQEGIVEIAGSGGKEEPGARNGPPALELLVRDVDSLVIQPSQGGLHAIRTHALCDLLIPYPGAGEEPSVRATRMGEDPALKDAQKRLLPGLQLMLESLATLLGSQRALQKSPQAQGISEDHLGVIEHRKLHGRERNAL